MDVNAIYVKTEKGEEEIRSRAYKLSQRLRTILIMVDGTTTGGGLAQKAKALGVPDDFMEHLLEGGFVAPQTTESPAQSAAAVAATPVVPMGADELANFIAVQKFMNATVSDALGFRGLPMVLKIERASSRDELRALVDELTERLNKAIGPLRAKGIVDQLRGLLS
jgi:hypothetical protein